MTFSLTWLPGVLLAEGLKVAEVDGWRTRGRREMGTVVGVMCHHTAGPLKGNMPSLKVLTDGRPATKTAKALPGPLSQLGLGRDGTFYVVAAGACNHAGEGSWQGHTSGNRNFIGIEAENIGTGKETWPDVQMDAYMRGVAAILRHIGADPMMCCGHLEYAPRRKIDPVFNDGFNMKTFRARVKLLMNGTATRRPLIPPKSVTNETGAAITRRTLRRGMEGDDVKDLQRRLGLAGKDVDGVFGRFTEAAVRDFQRGKTDAENKAIVPDGIVGPKTWALLLRAPASVPGN
jgi:peptidoglycan hydrolase-like protein with peptidoglycan-binding domain